MVLSFPSSAPFAQVRKRGARSHSEIKAPIASNHVDLIEDVRLDIVSTWRKGVSIAFIAKMHQLTVGQTEAVIWVELFRSQVRAFRMFFSRRAA